MFYYWVLVLCFFAAPQWSYKFSEMLETHAVSTYRVGPTWSGDRIDTTLFGQVIVLTLLCLVR